MSYYQHHIFFCLNQRDNGEACCAARREGRLRPLQARVKARPGRPGGVRVNKAGCLDRCAGGPVAGGLSGRRSGTPTSTRADIDEIVDKHLKNGQVVERLLLPPSVGR